MKILAVDTATSSCSVAIVDNKCLLAEYICANKKSHSINLMSIIEKVFQQCGLRPRNLNGIAVSVGPGTFTGLRIGISTVKGLAYSLDKPVVGVNSLDALAFPMSEFRRPVIPMIDARRGEVYYSCYSNPRGLLDAKRFYNVASPQKVLPNIPDDAVLVGSGAVVYSDFFQKHLSTVTIEKRDTFNVIRAFSVACLAEEKFVSGNIDNINTLIPYYIRKSDVQVNGVFK